MRGILNKTTGTISLLLSMIMFITGCAGALGAQSAQSRMSDSQLLNSLAFYEGVSIDGKEFAGKARLVAVEELKAEKEPILDSSKIKFNYNDKSFEYSLRDLGFYYDYDGATKKAFGYGRDGSDEQKLEMIRDLTKNPVNVDLEMLQDNEKLNAVIDAIHNEIKIDAVDGGYSYDSESGKVVAKKGEPGLGVDREKISEMILSSSKSLEAITVPTSPIEVNPHHEELAARVNGVIGAASSTFNPWFWERVTNIEVSTDALNGIVVAPGEVFSVNDCIGDTTYDKGYQKSIVIVGTKEVPGMGGGVCQTSTTLYQAVLKADLEIVERQSHTLNLSYYDGGLDAAIEYGLADLVFKNNYDFPILIKGYYSEGQVNFEIWGDTNVKNYEVSLFSELQYNIPYSTEYVHDDTLAPGTSKTKTAGVTGSYYEAYRKNESTGEVEHIGGTYYPAVNEVILKGPDAPEPAPAEPEPAPAPDPAPEEPSEPEETTESSDND
ncbi:VanW family protein [Microaceticoccus formicicus]|uniref:VanW family protein n=1 Tax=Microaceticoccus formicicus TaxID=3118105 RepID=UPI003CD032B9|nr:VanW family protein [Peptoniphilaceae bacterium AMB_02]